MTGKKEMTERKEMTRNKRHVLVIPAVPPVIPAVPLFNPALLFVIPAVFFVIPAVLFVIPALLFVIPALLFVILALLFVIPAKAGIQVTGRTGWIPAPHFRGDEFTPSEAGAGMTEKMRGNTESLSRRRPCQNKISSSRPTICQNDMRTAFWPWTI
jgi:hypothetical protein